MVAVGLGYVRLVLVVGTYIVLATGYRLGLKHLAIVEVGIVASGFVLPALAGAAATGVPASGWFLVVVCACAVMVAVGKRSAELPLADAAARYRSSLRGDGARGLSAARLVAAVILVGCYLGWVVTRPVSQMPAAAVSAVAVSAVAVSAVAVAVSAGRFLAHPPGVEPVQATPPVLRSASAAGRPGVAGHAGDGTCSCLGGGNETLAHSRIAAKSDREELVKRAQIVERGAGVTFRAAAICWARTPCPSPPDSSCPD
jgi:hypothetical protein